MRVLGVFAVLCGLVAFSNAQWSDNFDTYAAGSEIIGQGGWQGWDLAANAGGNVVTTQSLSAPNALQNIGTSDTVHKYSGYTSGVWRYSASVFAPARYA